MISSFPEERYTESSKRDSAVVGKVSLKDLETSLKGIIHSQDGHKLESDFISSQSSEYAESSKKAAFAGGFNEEDEENEDEEEEEEEDLTAYVLSAYDGYNPKPSESYSSKPSHRKPVPILSEPCFTMISSFPEERYTEPSKCDGAVVREVSLKDLETSLKGIIHSQDDHKLGSDFISSQSSEYAESSKKAAFAGGFNEEDEENEEEEEEEEEEDLTAYVLSAYDGYNPKPSESYSSKPSHRRPVPILSGENLVSAIKGSRAKLGKPKKHQRVTWAPSVYDPPPSATTMVRHRQPILNITPKKNAGKNKQKPKGKAARKQAKASKWRRGGDDDSD